MGPHEREALTREYHDLMRAVNKTQAQGRRLDELVELLGFNRGRQIPDPPNMNQPHPPWSPPVRADRLCMCGFGPIGGCVHCDGAQRP